MIVFDASAVVSAALREDACLSGRYCAEETDVFALSAEVDAEISRGHRQVVGPWLRYGSLCQSGNPGDLGPRLEGLGPGGSIMRGGKVIATEVKEIVDLIMGGEETLGLSG